VGSAQNHSHMLNLATDFSMLRIASHKLNKLMDSIIASLLYWRMSAVSTMLSPQFTERATSPRQFLHQSSSVTSTDVHD
jgi:hypothetical protein